MKNLKDQIIGRIGNKILLDILMLKNILCSGLTLNYISSIYGEKKHNFVKVVKQCWHRFLFREEEKS